MTDKQTPSENSEKPVESTKKQEFTTKVSANTAKDSQTNLASKSTSLTKNKKRSKTAIVALVCSITALASLTAGYIWQSKQNKALSQELATQSQAQLNNATQQLQEQISKQQASTIVKTKKITEDALVPVHISLDQLKSTTESLKKNDPTDWLLHEAEYLIRVASRTIWLEKDTKAAINLLQDADRRIKELNDPEYLPIRQLINQDIESLKLLPELATEDVILKLMALGNQVNDLPIAMAHLPQATEEDESFELSENTADWKENLAKTWHKFMADFITVKRRTANVEALLTPAQQQHLRQNLLLKLQLSQWAATQYKNALYNASLTEVDTWLKSYFDIDDIRVQNFLKAIEQLKSAIIMLTLPSKLDSLKSIRETIKAKPQKAELPNGNLELKSQTLENSTLPNETKVIEVKSEIGEDDSGVIL